MKEQMHGAVLVKMASQLSEIMGKLESNPPPGISLASRQMIMAHMRAQFDALQFASVLIVERYGVPAQSSN